MAAASKQLTAPAGGLISAAVSAFLSREGVFKCPEDQLPLDYAKIYPDPDLEVQVLSLTIRCIHSEEGCRWSGTIRHLQAHLGTCSFNVVPCPNRCGVKLSRRDLPAHVQHDCPQRHLKCEFCGTDFTGEAYENHEGLCPQESVYCENKCGARMMRRLLSQHMLVECPKRTQPCSYCAKDFLYDTIQHCQKTAGHLKKTADRLGLCPFGAGCKHRCQSCIHLFRHLGESTKLHLELMVMVTRQRQELTRAIAPEKVEEAGQVEQRHGVLIWKIADYSRQTARSS
uniref:TNF receptor-associated factor 4 n=1 Tax=Sphaerodactylus townsendi TaxID=933632 RepID=A0ACB8ECK9_9SAUR